MTSTRMGLGFLYQDYKVKFYYWEIIKITLKMFIVFIHNILIEYKIIESTIVTLALLLYLFSVMNKKPILN